MSSSRENSRGWQLIDADEPAWELFLPVAPWWNGGRESLLAEIFVHAPCAEAVNTSLWRLDRAVRFILTRLWCTPAASSEQPLMFSPAPVSYAYSHFSSLSKEQNHVNNERSAKRILGELFR